MIHILPDRLLIEIRTNQPIDEAFYIKQAILQAVEAISESNQNMGQQFEVDFHCLAKLVSEMDYEPELLNNLFGFDKNGRFVKGTTVASKLCEESINDLKNGFDTIMAKNQLEKNESENK